jgi:hypothetical protein
MNASNPSGNREAAGHSESAGNAAGRDNKAALGAADWVALAAAPTFAIMALLVGVSSEASPLSGMVVMYVLMAAFETVAWLRLISTRRSGFRANRSFAIDPSGGRPDQKKSTATTEIGE